jgi:hypothetical protein
MTPATPSHLSPTGRPRDNQPPALPLSMAGRRNPWVIAFVVSLATFMEVLDTSIANVALAHIAGNLSASLDESTWVLTSYLVSNAIVLPISGWLATAQSQIPPLETALKQGIHRLGVLMGQEPGALLTELSTVAPISTAPPEVPVGLPADLLRRRPEIRRAERQVAAATARIGVAAADLYPKLSLTSSIGLESLQLADLAKGVSRFWSVGPTLSWPIFDAGRIRGRFGCRATGNTAAVAGSGSPDTGGSG